MFKARLDTFANDFGPFRIFEIFWRLDPPWNTGQKFVGKNCPKTCSKHVCTLLGIFWAFLEFSKFFDFFENFRRLDPPWNTGQKFFFEKNAPKHVWTLGKVFRLFRKFETFWLFSWIFSKSLPQKLSLENWTQFFYVRKTELMFLSSGIWTHNFKSRTSEMELRIMTVAWMQKNVCWVLCRKTELIFLSPEN